MLTPEKRSWKKPAAVGVSVVFIVALLVFHQGGKTNTPRIRNEIESKETPAKILHYAAANFNNLPTLADQEQNKEVNREVVKELGQVFTDHNVQSFLGLTLLHKHFDVSDDEAVVEVFNERGSEAKPYTLQTLNDMERAGNAVVPWAFRVESDGSLVPVEFSASDKKYNTKLLDNYERLKSSGVFTKALAKKMSELGVLNIFGLGIQHRGFIESVAQDGEIREDNDCENRVSRMVAVSDMVEEEQGQQYSNTFWTFRAFSPKPSLGHGRSGVELRTRGCLEGKCQRAKVNV